jgi:predicted GH43/DUF377 family glycosyl hydrolase
MKLKRYAKNPILKPDPKLSWERAYTCNPGAWFDGQHVWLLYRAGPDTLRHPIYFGLAASRDGFTFRRVSRKPVFGPSADGFDAGCVEDARIVRWGALYAVTYAARMFPPGAYWRHTVGLDRFNPPLPDEAPKAARTNLTRSGLALTPDFKRWYRMGPITDATVDNRDVILFPEKIGGRFAMLHRPASWKGPGYGCDRPSMWIAFSEDPLHWPEHELFAVPEFDWEAKKIGGGTPPLRTRHGWLTFYHGVDASNVYRAGVMLLDLQDPRRILARLPEPVLEPEADHERIGRIPNVVFPTGHALMGDRLIVYYGGADHVCCAASVSLEALLAALRKARPARRARPRARA